MFLALELLLEYCIEHATARPLNVNFVFSTKMLQMEVQGYGSDFPYGVC